MQEEEGRASSTTVAIAPYVVFTALALHEHPACRETLPPGGDDEVRCFVQELLNLYGTNRDFRVWKRSDAFEPERFRDWSGSPFTFIPQGDGDHETGHRCAAEWVTIALLEVIVCALVREMDYRVPPEDLRVSLRRMPTIPRSGVVIDRVRLAA